MTVPCVAQIIFRRVHGEVRLSGIVAPGQKDYEGGFRDRCASVENSHGTLPSD
jgi:hypothetical protein